MIKAEILDMPAERFADAYYMHRTPSPIKFNCEDCAYSDIDCGNIDCRDACIEFLNSEVPDEAFRNLKGEFIYTESRHPDCPLREIPAPQGRLVNADEAVIHTVKAVQEYYHKIYGDESYAHVGVYDVIEKAIDEVSEVVRE